MRKRVSRNDVYYHLVWSAVHVYDRHSASRVLPELPGIICFLEKGVGDRLNYLLFYECWRDGLRFGVKMLFDPLLGPHPELQKAIEGRDLHYKFTVVDSTTSDMRDILFWLIQQYRPELNNDIDFEDSGRYEKIFLKEMVMRKGEVVERFPFWSY